MIYLRITAGILFLYALSSGAGVIVMVFPMLGKGAVFYSLLLFFAFPILYFTLGVGLLCRKAIAIKLTPYVSFFSLVGQVYYVFKRGINPMDFVFVVLMIASTALPLVYQSKEKKGLV